MLASPAMLSTTESFEAAAYADRFLVTSDLKRVALAAAYRKGKIAGGLAVGHFSSPGLRETSLQLRTSRSLGKAHLGIGASYQLKSIPGYGSSGATGLQAGVVADLTSTVRASMQIANFYTGKGNRTNGNYLPLSYALGFCYRPSEIVFIETTIEKVQDIPFDVQLFLFYQALESFYAKAGVLTSTGTLVAAAGWRRKGLGLMISVIFGRYNGMVPGVMATYKSEGG